MCFFKNSCFSECLQVKVISDIHLEFGLVSVKMIKRNFKSCSSRKLKNDKNPTISISLVLPT